jgi:hypothetical protein
MNDAAMVTIVVLVLGAITALVAAHRSNRSIRRWIGAGFVLHMVCAGAQILYITKVYGGGDALWYANAGVELAKLLSANFAFIAPELGALLFQRPSLLDPLCYGGGQSNTGSMHAIAAWFAYALQGSAYASWVLAAGLAFFGTLCFFSAFRDASKDLPPFGLLVSTVLFPSIAFWTAALLKESFCVMGLGLLLFGWRAAYQRNWLRFVIATPLGLEIMYLFRAPAIPPVAIGILVYFVVERVQKARGVDAAVVGPLYLVLGALALTGGLVALTSAIPSLSLDQLAGTVAMQQQRWGPADHDSTFGGVAEDADLSVRAQLVRVPIALLTALLRPQLFDVHNATALISAIEMTAITWFLIQAVRRNGLSGAFRRVQRSPFLLMCALTTLIGCTFVGLVTFNFGSLARYRVPFLPFYAALLYGLNHRVPARVPDGAVDRRRAVGPSRVGSRPQAAPLSRRRGPIPR